MGLVCAVCNREVRFGLRGGRRAWWHEDDRPDESIVRHRRLAADGSVGHEPIIGRAKFDVDWEAVEAQRQRYQLEVENEQEDNRIFEIPPVEVWSTEIQVNKAEPDPRMPGGAKDLINATHKAGGETLATYSRAPRIHASHGNLLGMGDYVVVKFRVEPEGVEPRTGVGRWEDLALDCAYITEYDLSTDRVTPTRVTSKALRAWLVKAERSD